MNEKLKECFQYAGYFILGGMVLIGGTGSLSHKTSELKNPKTKADSFYNALFKNAKNFGDSLAIYNHYCLPIKLEEPTFEEKETAVKINKLEKEIK